MSAVWLALRTGYVGHALHAALGGLWLGFVLRVGWPLWMLPVGLTIMGLHELADGDFRRSRGGPWNGVGDVLAFWPVALWAAPVAVWWSVGWLAAYLVALYYWGGLLITEGAPHA